MLTELTNVLEQFMAVKNQLSELQKRKKELEQLQATLGDQVKHQMKKSNLSTITLGGINASVKVINSVTYENGLLEKLKELNIDGLVKTKTMEYIDEQKLSDCIYEEQIDQELIKGFETVTTTERLTVKEKK